MHTITCDRLTQARLLRRKTIAEVAQALSWPAHKLSRVESLDSYDLSDAEFDSLLETLNFPWDFFARSPSPALVYGGMMHRRTQRTRKSEIAYWDEFARFSADFALEMHGLRSLPPVVLPTMDYRVSTQAASSEVRGRFGLAPDEPIDDLTLRSELAGVVVVHHNVASEAMPSTGRFYGGSAWVRGQGKLAPIPVVILNSIDSWERYRLTLAHELGHLVCHAQDRPVDDVTLESQAFEFASELLAPARFLRRELPTKPTLNSFLPMKRKWGISLGALLKHLESNHLLDEGLVHALQKQLYTRRNPKSGKTWGATEPGYDERMVEKPKLLDAWVSKFYGDVSTSAVANLIKFAPEDLLGLSLSRPVVSPDSNVVSIFANRR